ncbi:hypothetical protein Q7689_09585, partial [Nocardiopsis tropica]|nr:hypothetical protein [Nocardiopsis tropica]
GMPVEQFPPPAYVGADQSFLPTPSPSEEPTEEESEEPSDEPSDFPECDPANIDPENPNCEGVESPPECDQFDWECQNEGNPDVPEECTGPNPPSWCEEQTTPGEPGDDASDDDGGLGWPRSSSNENNRMIVLGRDE